MKTILTMALWTTTTIMVGCGRLATVDAGLDGGSDGSACLYYTAKYGWVQCPVDGKTRCLRDEWCAECYCSPTLKIECRKNDCRLPDGGECCWWDE